jgi:hypothetical protein
MDTAAVIELGDDWAPDYDAPAPAGSWRDRWGGWLRPAAAAASLLLILVLAGSAVARPVLTQVRSLPTVSDRAAELGSDRLFVTQSGSESTTVITAYPLPVGAPLWRAPMSHQSVDGLQLVPEAGVLLAWTSTNGGPDRQFTVIDANTGQARLRSSDAALADMRPDGRMLLSRPGSVGPSLSLVDLRSGEVVWMQQQAHPTEVAVAQSSTGGPGSRRIALRSPDGTAQILDEDTGSVLVTGRLPAPVATVQSTGLDQVGLSVIGDQVLIVEPRGEDTLVTAYDLVRLGRRWQVTVPGPAFTVAGCGPVLCMQADRGLFTLDPASGRIRWRSSQWQAAWFTEAWLVALAPQSGDRFTIVDPVDGRPLLDLGQWSLRSLPRPGASALLIASKPGRPGAWLGLLDESTFTVRTVGWLPDADRARCQVSRAAPVYVVCAVNHRVTVWRYDPPH